MMYKVCFLLAAIVAVSANADADAEPSFKCHYVCRHRIRPVHCNPWQIKRVVKVRIGYCWCQKVICINKPVCHYRGRKLRIGQMFRKGCQKCTCNKNRRVTCRSVCPKKVKKCNPYQKAIWIRYRFDKHCYCSRTKCIPRKCHYRGRYYHIGQMFRRGCHKCTCNRNGKVTCRSVCPRKVIKCNKYQKAIWIRFRFDKHCYCSKTKCIPNKCHYRGRYYHIGQMFRRGCHKCTCNRNGKVTCRSVCPKKVNKCNRYQKAIWVRFRFDKHCYCSKTKCVPKVCRYKRGYVPVGKHFVTKNCRHRCWCLKSGVLRCVPLCRHIPTPKCGYYYFVKSHTRVVSRHPYCRCVVSKKCVRKHH